MDRTLSDNRVFAIFRLFSKPKHASNGKLVYAAFVSVLLFCLNYSLKASAQNNQTALDNIVITTNPSDVNNLAVLGQVEIRKTGFFGKQEKLTEKAYIDLKQQALLKGGNIIYITTNEYIPDSKNYFNAVHLVGTAYKQVTGGNSQQANNSVSNNQENIVKNIDDGIDFNVTSSTRDAAAQTVTIYFSFSNPRKVHQRINVFGSGYNPNFTKAIDENGSQVLSKSVTLANVNDNFNAEVELVNGGTIKGSITFMNVLPSVNKLSLVNINVQSCNWEGQGDRKGGVIEIKNLIINTTINSGSANSKPFTEATADNNDNIVKNIDDGIDFSFNGCTGNSKNQTVTIYFTFSNPRKVNQKLGVYGSGYNSNLTKAIDDNGNQIASQSVSLANATNNFATETELVYGTKIDGSITFINVLPTVSKLSLVNMNTATCNWDGGADRKGGVIEIKSVAIKWDNKPAGTKSTSPTQSADYITYDGLLTKLNNGENTTNKKVILDNIYFETNEDVLTDNSKATLQSILKLLIKYPKLKITILGHTDNVGRDDDNLSLSFGRAKAVVNYLVSKGISRNRLFYKGFGSTVPIDDNNTADGRAKNRRTELEVMEQ
jgi:outer membrane protein OmpA-like peptidoglycan-associated protein